MRLKIPVEFLEPIARWLRVDEAGGTTVSIVSGEGKRVWGRLLGGGQTFWTLETIPDDFKIVRVDPFTGSRRTK